MKKELGDEARDGPLDETPHVDGNRPGAAHPDYAPPALPPPSTSSSPKVTRVASIEIYTPRLGKVELDNA